MKRLHAGNGMDVLVNMKPGKVPALAHIERV